jgi:Putative multicopper oxidases
LGLFRKSDKAALGAASASFALLAMVLAFASLIVVATRDNGSGTTVLGGAGAQITLSEFKIEPGTITVSSGGSVTVTNNGTVRHNLSIQGTKFKTKDLDPGESATLVLKGLKNGSYTVFCAIPGHEQAGMKGAITVGSAGAVQNNQSGSAGATAQQLLTGNLANDKSQGAVVTTYAGQLTKIVANFVKTGKVDPALYDANTSYGPEFTALGGNPLLGPPVLKPEVGADGTKLFHLVAKVVQWEISPGNKVSAYTYNGMVPAPTIMVNQGDKVVVEVKNELPQSTAVHFHGIDTPVGMDGVPFVTQDPVLPGKTFTYRFTATNRPQVGMYHSHYHAEHQIADGEAGAFIVGSTPIPASVAANYPTATQFPAANTPYVMMLNDSGSIGLALNGKAFPGTAPLVTPVDHWIEIDYLNEGQQFHPMHLHGMEQLVIAKDGEPLTSPYLADTVGVGPGERYTVLVKPDKSKLDTLKQTAFAPFGVWAFHCHIIAHAESNNGFIGMTTTFIVLP